MKVAVQTTYSLILHDSSKWDRWDMNLVNVNYLG